MPESNAPRDRVVSVRFTDAEIAELETLAAGHGTTVGGYLGGIVAAETGIEPAIREPGRAQTGRYRVGSSLLRTLYDGDSCFGMVDTPEQAAMIVAALNARPAENDAGALDVPRHRPDPAGRPSAPLGTPFHASDSDASPPNLKITPAEAVRAFRHAHETETERLCAPGAEPEVDVDYHATAAGLAAVDQWRARTAPNSAAEALAAAMHTLRCVPVLGTDKGHAPGGSHQQLDQAQGRFLAATLAANGWTLTRRPPEAGTTDEHTEAP